jgi:hypothetical protein
MGGLAMAGMVAVVTTDSAWASVQGGDVMRSLGLYTFFSEPLP